MAFTARVLHRLYSLPLFAWADPRRTTSDDGSAPDPQKQTALRSTTNCDQLAPELGLFVAPAGAERDEVELAWNLHAWNSKPRLRQAYRRFYEEIAARLKTDISGSIVEIGARFGRIKEVVPACITTDLVPHPWLDQTENAYALSFGDATVSHLILVDVWHHLRFPGAALAEFHRVLAPGGRLILLEPAVSWLGRLVYGFFHYEPIALRHEMNWETPPDFDPASTEYYAAQGNATRLFWWGEHPERLAGWRVSETTPLATLTYFATGGFSRPQIGGERLFRCLARGERVAAAAPRIFAGRLLVVLEKASSSTSQASMEGR